MTRDKIIKAAELLKAELAQAIACPCCATKFDRYATVLKRLIALVPDDNRDWSVFCALCGKSWSVKGYHPGKTVCEDCEKLHKAMFRSLLQNTEEDK